MKVSLKKKKNHRMSFNEREDLILDAALKLFSNFGFEGTVTKKIVEKAGINEALLFRHFPSKEKLYSGLLRKKLELFDQRFLPELEKTMHLPVQKGMEHIAEILIRKMRKDLSCMRMVLFAALERPRFSRFFFQQRLPLSEFLQRFFQAKIKNGELQRGDADTLARAFYAMIYHYFMVRYIFRAPDSFFKPAKMLFRDYVLFLLRGVQR